jgi:PKD repeat protein
MIANVLPTANFTVTTTGYRVTVTSNSFDSDGTIASYSWVWNDNTSNGELSTMNHTYQYAGTYNISLTVTDDYNGVSVTPKVISVTVPTTMPTANFIATVNKQTVTFNASISTNPFGTIANYTWTYGDGTTQTTTTPNTSRTYATVGTFNVTLKIVDEHNATSTISKNVTTVANVAPVANFTSLVSGYTVTVNSTSIDNDGTVSVWAYNFGDGSANGTAANSSHNYSAPGTYTITLSVKDNDGASSATTKTASVIVPSVMPSANFVPTVNKLSVSFDTSLTTSPSGTISTYLWTYGNGQTETKTSANATHLYTSAGTFTVTLKITDDHGATSTISKTVTTIANIAPTANFTYSVSGYIVTVNSSSSDSDGNVVSWLYIWGDNKPNDTT